MISLFSFPRGIAAVKLDEGKMRHEIYVSVCNINGFRPQLFTSYMAFENLMKRDIERLKEPVVVCIDSVVEQLTSAVRNCTKHVSVLNR